MAPTVIRVDGQIFLLSTGRQPDSLAPVWALIGHLTPYTHTQDCAPRLGSTSLGGCVKKIQPVISRLSPAGASLPGSYGNSDNRGVSLGCRRR